MVFLTATLQRQVVGQFKQGRDRYWRKKIIFDHAKHFYGRHRNCYSLTIRAVHRAWVYQNRYRHLKKNNLRKLWIVRLNAAAKEHGLKYSSFIGGLVQHHVALDRKILSQLAVYEPKTFQCLTELAKRKTEEGILSALVKNPDKVVNRLTTQQDLLEEGIRKLRLSSTQEAKKTTVTS
ncbi:putative 39S ribosomal protein L20, mitochondrial [Apostichopus japonicus]|uniref:Large ribosomal subunit protein bL20c n=1 Tax=Stichopus japonicus TaxID=307972 RepID=A0A2G8KMN1_STIJA|nr:putative 39S ribosomal protein L20, mitochondrial [Apostichopus japonicus]